MSLLNVCLCLFSKNAKTFLPVIGKQSQFDNTLMTDVLGFTLRDVKVTQRTLIEKGLVKKLKRVLTQGASAVAKGDANADEEVGKKENEDKVEKETENGDVDNTDVEKDDRFVIG